MLIPVQLEIEYTREGVLNICVTGDGFRNPVLGCGFVPGDRVVFDSKNVFWETDVRLHRDALRRAGEDDE